MKQYGVFINYRRKNCYMAGRIYDDLKRRGFVPFLDIYELHQGDFGKDLREVIQRTPYFLCVLTKDCFKNLRPDDNDDTYFREIKDAMDFGKKILLVADADFRFPKNVPEQIMPLRVLNRYSIDREMKNFFVEMDRLCANDIRFETIAHLLDWRELAKQKADVYVTSRTELESGIASLSNRFGAELIDCIKEKKPFLGENRIQHINMSCYAASVILTPERHMLDHRAYDYGMMFNIFSELFQDEDFSMTLITNSPDSPAAIDSISASKLGNSSFPENQRCVFLGSYANIHKLIREEPFKSAMRNKRFSSFVTDAILPFAYFQIIYKEQWSEYNHIKIDLYTEGIGSYMRRRSMIFFERDHTDAYTFLQTQFIHLQERCSAAARQTKQRVNGAWLEEWEQYLKGVE